MQETRIYPSSRPVGHVPPIARFTARPQVQGDRIVALFCGVQARDSAALDDSGFDGFLAASNTGDTAPAYLDRAGFVDKAGFENRLAAMYWNGVEAFEAWAASRPVKAWRGRAVTPEPSYGTWWEPVAARIERTETIAFKEFLRGVSACPFSQLENTEASGYWGAARDRIPSSAYDRLEGAAEHLAFIEPAAASRSGRLVVTPPRGLTIIRSGVSWAACGEEQLQSYERNVRPKLDAGMDYLVGNPIDTGCCSLRQVTSQDASGAALKEGYSLGAFLSLSHLEGWAKHHPTHLAIYNRAMMERKKYQERLELRTYNEIYVLDDDVLDFEYDNCHPETGLIRFFPARQGVSSAGYQR
jgi:aldoxime dehydratase